MAKKTKTKKLSVKCKITKDDSLYLHDSIASGKYNGKEFKLVRILPSCILLMRYDGKAVAVNMNDLGLAMLEALKD